MKSLKHGKNILELEILNISRHGIWLWIRGKEYFLDYDHYPWFKKAAIDDIFNVELEHQTHLYWPTLDVDLDVDCIENAEKYPLTFV